MSNRIEDLIEKARHYENLWKDALEENKYQKEKAQDMFMFICKCVVNKDFKTFKNGNVDFGKKGKRK